MHLKEYYEFLNLASGDRLLVFGKEAMPLGLYAAGRAKAAGLTVEVQIAADPATQIKNEAALADWIRANEPDAKQEITAGAPIVAHCTSTLNGLPPMKPFNKMLVSDDDFANGFYEKLTKLDMLSCGEKALLLDLPLSFVRPVPFETKGLLGSKTEFLSFRQFLERLGLKVDYYERHEKRLVCAATLVRPGQTPPLKLLDCDGFAAEVRKELLPHIEKTAGGSQFAIDAGEWLYFVQVEDIANAPLQVVFALPDCSSCYTEPKATERSKKFLVAVMPNTPSSKRELAVKGTAVVKKEEAAKLFAERK